MPAAAHSVNVNYIRVPSPIGDIGTNYNPVYAWNKVADATWYRLFVSGPGGKVILDQWYKASSICDDTLCLVTPGPSFTLGGGNYAWYVQSYSAAGYGPWSARMDFNTTIPSLPGAATLVSPKGDIGTNYNPTYTWNKVPTVTWYRLYVSGPKGKVVLDQWYEASKICLGTIVGVGMHGGKSDVGGGAYVWYVQTWNPAGYGPWSNNAQPTNFTTHGSSRCGNAGFAEGRYWYGLQLDLHVEQSADGDLVPFVCERTERQSSAGSMV